MLSVGEMCGGDMNRVGFNPFENVSLEKKQVIVRELKGN